MVVVVPGVALWQSAQPVVGEAAHQPVLLATEVAWLIEVLAPLGLP